MGHRPLEAILKRNKQSTFITLWCVACRTVVKQGKFPSHCPVSAMYEWIERKNDTLFEWHTCDLDSLYAGKPSLHRTADTSFFGLRTKLGHTRERVARMILVWDRIRSVWSGKRSTR